MLGVQKTSAVSAIARENGKTSKERKAPHPASNADMLETIPMKMVPRHHSQRPTQKDDRDGTDHSSQLQNPRPALNNDDAALLTNP